jgi:hypothetical protein
MDLLRRGTFVPLSLASVWVLAGCSSSGPTAPTANDVGSPSARVPSAEAGSLEAGTALTFVSAETSTPASGVTVTIGENHYRTDGAGEVRLNAPLGLPASVEVVSDQYLLRETVIGAHDGLRFSLWPRQSPTGLDEERTRQLVYTDASGGEPGALRLHRVNPPAGRVSVVLSSALAADPEAVRAHQEAAETLSRATGGAVTFVVEATATSPVSVYTSIDMNDPAMRNHAALAYRHLDGSLIVGGRVVFISSEVSHMAAVVAHELGHTFGLEHSPSPQDLMYPIVSGPKDFSLGERLAMELMLQRRPGNRFPDNDRDGASAQTGKRTEIVACGG